jgi:methylated-DNA-[protein]-cysteine S-methyltransferase
MMSALVETTYSSPLGSLRLVADASCLRAVILPSHRKPPMLEAREESSHPILEQAVGELTEYFGGARREFSTPLSPHGTAFQQAVWQGLLTIPFGQTRSYSQLAVTVGKPAAVRAVGSANGRNPLSIFIPCHRVIGADGSLTGYAGGTPFKQWLLDHEATLLGRMSDMGP